MSEPQGRGYWLLSPPSLFALERAAPSEELRSALLSWARDRTEEHFAERFPNVQFEVIEANYHGPYSCLAARAVTGEVPDDLTENEIDAHLADALRRQDAEQLLAAVFRHLGAPARRAAA